MNKEKTAKWMGYDTVEAMDRDHDPLHTAIAAIFGVTSHSMRVARGEKVNHDDWTLGNYEEEAVLNLQRWLRKIGYFDG